MSDKDCCNRDGRIAMCNCEDRKECKGYSAKQRNISSKVVEDCIFHRPDIMPGVCDKPRD